MYNSDLADAIESLDIEYWLDREGIQYRKTTGSHGVQLNVKTCPVCGCGNWKVYLNAETGLGNCFHGDCQAKFNKWKFISAYLGNLSKRQVVDHIKAVSEETGWRPKKEVNHAQENVFENTRFFMPEMIDIADAIRKHGSGFRSAKYLYDRNITFESIEYFKLGDCLTGYFQYRKADGNIGYQDYSGRIIIPIFDIDGKTVTFQGRDYTGESPKRYLFPPGLNATGTLFYNGWNFDGHDQIVIGEGVFDCIAIRQAFKKETALNKVLPVASFGKHISLSSGGQIDYLKKLRDKGLKVCTFMWDGEVEALKDAVKAALEVAKLGLTVRVATLPKDRDPNECTPEEVIKAFWEAVPINRLSAIKFLLSLN